SISARSTSSWRRRHERGSSHRPQRRPLQGLSRARICSRRFELYGRGRMSTTDRGRRRSLEVTGGPAQAAARSMLRAMGWTSDDLQLPQAGVAATWNRVTPCNMHLDELALAAADELRKLEVLPL